MSTEKPSKYVDVRMPRTQAQMLLSLVNRTITDDPSVHGAVDVQGLDGAAENLAAALRNR